MTQISRISSQAGHMALILLPSNKTMPQESSASMVSSKLSTQILVQTSVSESSPIETIAMIWLQTAVKKILT